MEKAQIIKSVSGSFWVKLDTQVLVVNGRKKHKEDKLLVGDIVEINKEQLVIEKLCKRKNMLIRPPLANVEQALIVVAPIPKPDFELIDKMLVFCMANQIKPVLIINKTDICAVGFIDSIVEQYKDVCKIEMISALDYNTTATILNPLLTGKFSILTGQSAVGKSSILNCLCKDIKMETGDISKIGRGKNTTRHSEIFVLENGAMVADTPGFNALELDEFTKEDVVDSYIEFGSFSKNCKYHNCNHINEKITDCAVKQALNNNAISKARYDRYVKLYLELQKKEKKQYD